MKEGSRWHDGFWLFWLQAVVLKWNHVLVLIDCRLVRATLRTHQSACAHLGALRTRSSPHITTFATTELEVRELSLGLCVVLLFSGLLIRRIRGRLDLEVHVIKST